MPRKPDPSLKTAIVDKVVTHLRSTPLDAVSVRSLGRVLGTSAYPIVYHFGSRAALVDAVIDRLAVPSVSCRLDERADAAALGEHLVAVYGGLDQPDRALAARLAFELGAVESLAAPDDAAATADTRGSAATRSTTTRGTGRPLGPTRRHATMHRDQVATLAAWCTAHGMPDSAAESAAQDAVLTARGAQWGYLLQPDAAAARAVDAALRRIAERLAESASLPVH